MPLTDKLKKLAYSCSIWWAQKIIAASSVTSSSVMMADHGEPCTGPDASYCMNEGTCFKIPSMSTLTCVCNDNYIGSRCEQFQLESTSDNSHETGMIAAISILLVLILLVLAVIIYYICKVRRKDSRTTRDIA